MGEWTKKRVRTLINLLHINDISMYSMYELKAFSCQLVSKFCQLELEVLIEFYCLTLMYNVKASTIKVALVY